MRWRGTTDRRGASRSTTFFLVFLVLACGDPGVDFTSEPSGVALASVLVEPGDVREGHLEPGEEHHFTLSLDASEAVEINIEQQGADVVLEILGPDGHSLVVDAPLGGHGYEHACWPAETSGEVRLRLTTFPGTSGGGYLLRLGAARAASAAHGECRVASLAFLAAEELQGRQGSDPRLRADLYQQAGERWSRLPAHDFQHALALRQAASSLRAAGELEAEREALEEALARMQSLGESAQQSALHNLLGLNHLHRIRPKEAKAAFDSALALARSSRRPDLEASAWNNQALLAETLGDPHQAVELYSRALSIWRSLGDRRSAALALYNLGVGQASAGRFVIANGLLSQALEEHRLLDDLEYQAASLSAIGWIYLLEGDPASAAEEFEEALGIARRAGSRRREAEALDRLGSARRELGDSTAARAAFRSAIEIVRETGNQRDLAHSTANLGRLLVETGEPREGREVLERAQRIFIRLGDRDALAHVLAGLAEADRRLGRLDEARGALEEAFEIVQSLRATTRLRGLFERSFDVRQEYAERYVDLLIELAGAEEAHPLLARAFEVADLVRAQSFHEMLLESEIDLLSGIDPELVERARGIRERLDAARGLHLGLRDEGEAEAAGRQVEALLFDLETAEAEVRRASPRAAEIADPSSTPVRVIQQHLDSGTLLLNYALGQRRSFLFTATPDSLTVYKLPGREAIEVLAERVYGGLRRPRRHLGRRQLDLDSAAISRIILAPPAAEIADAARLLVVSEGGLLYLPFAALPLPGALGEHLLVDRLEVVHLPLAAALPTLARREADRPAPPGLLALVADPVFATADPRVTRGSAPDVVPGPGEVELPRLPASRREAEGILELIAARPHLLALGFAARKELVTDGELGRFRRLHFATHALLDDRYPQLSGLVLSRVDERGRQRDGYVRLHQIFALELPAELVVLSACQTALGEHRRGDGMVGLTRGFFYAGASRLLVSLWAVPDDATAELMIEFHRGLLREKLSTAAALRHAQLELRRRHPDRPPYSWAGFVLQGLP